MASRLLTVGLCATPAPPGDLSPEEAHCWNVAEAGRLVEEAAAQGAEIVCLPETFATYGAARRLPLEDLPGGETARECASWARRHGVHLIAPLAGVLDGVARNAALWFGPDGVYRDTYNKVHLTTPEMEQGLVPGGEWPVFEMECKRAETVRVGVFTCFDVNFPEAARLLALGGAEVLFHPTVYSMYGEVGWEAVLRSRAIDNCVYVCTVNHGIREDEPWMPGMCLGRSSVVGPDGLTLADGGRYAGMVTCTIDLARRRVVRAFGVAGEADFRDELWRHRRPETYGAIAGSVD
ncbi:MAG TPA: carbon-nitrogen hydrolase family protein [Chloroflexota bacterium]|nr:carbon-nitrogen hydrolase family protein [Chloroflexota bacterium]